MMRNPASFEQLQALAMPNGWTCFKYRSQNGLGGMDVQKPSASAAWLRRRQAISTKGGTMRAGDAPALT